MKRQIIKIDENLCNGCGLCIAACHESAIGLVNGKATLLRDDYCDGLGNCLPVCPTGAITFEMREALEYNEEEVKRNIANKTKEEPLACGCPGSHSREIRREPSISPSVSLSLTQSRLNQWPVQIQLVPTQAPYFDNANLLIAADCSAYAYANFHNEFMRNKITIIGCPKLDPVDYSEKLTEILLSNNIRSVTIVRMEVPCCGGIEHAAKVAMQNSGKMIPWQVITISTEGEILD